VLRKRKKALANTATASGADSNEFSWADIQDGIKVQETEEQAIKKQLKDFTQTNPEIVSQLIRTWLKGEE
jgi:flagellar biosynthesis/type III secretory pathway M-ring protein FliF/YscJ